MKTLLISLILLGLSGCAATATMMQSVGDSLQRNGQTQESQASDYNYVPKPTNINGQQVNCTSQTIAGQVYQNCN